MEPEDTPRVSQTTKKTRMPSFSSESYSDNMRSVQEVQTDRRRKKRGSNMEEHECSASSSGFGRRKCPSSTYSSFSSSSSLVLFIFTSALLLLVCAVPSQSLPFEGRSLSSSSSNNNHGGGSSRSRSHLDLLIDPIHQAEYGDDDPFDENTRVVKSVFDMVLRTPPPPTRSTNNCPPGTQSPFEGGPCIKKSTDPVATVDQSFLLDTLRDLAKEGVLFSGPSQKTRRPGGSGGSRRRTSGRRTTTTTAAPSTTMTSFEEGGGLEGEISPTTTDINTGDNMAADVDQEVVVVTEDPSTSSGTTPSVDDGEKVNPEETPGLAPSVDLIDSDTIAPAAEATTETVATTVPTTTTTTSTTTEASPVKNDDDVDLRRTAEPPQTDTSSSSEATGNDEQKVVVAAAATTTVPTTTFIETQTTATPEEQQVKSGQVQREEPVPTIMMMTTTTTTTTTSSTPNQVDQSSANSSSSDAGGSSRLSSHHDHRVVQISDQGDGQISPESQINNQDDHHGNHPVSLPSPTLSSSLPPPSSVIATAAVPTLPTFPKEEILTTTVDDVSYQTQADKDHHHDHVSPNGTEATTSPPAHLSSSDSSPMKTSTAVKLPKLIEAVGAENQVVTGVIFQTTQPDAQFQIENVSLADSLEMQEEEVGAHQPEIQHEDLSKQIMMTTQMMTVENGETPQIGQDDDGSSSPVTLSPMMPSSLFTDSEAPIQDEPKEIPSSEESSLTISFERESPAEPSVQDGFTDTIVVPEEEESNKKILSDAITGEGTKATIVVNNEKVVSPLGPLEKTTTVGDDTPIELHEQIQEQDPAAVRVEGIAGDINMGRIGTTSEQQIQVDEAGDSVNSMMLPGLDYTVNHSKEDAENDKGTDMATPQVVKEDFSLPELAPPVQDDDGQQSEQNASGMPTIEDIELAETPVNKDVGSDKGYLEVEKYLTSSEGQEEQPGKLLPEQGANEETIFDENKDVASSLETALVPPAATTNAPPTGSYIRFQPSGTLLQFQLPIVTRVPIRQHVDNDGGRDSFQPFPEFSPANNPGRVRFPNSAEEDDDTQGSTNLKPPAPSKPIFVEDFHLDYPSRHREALPPPLHQQWQVPKPFTSVESKATQDFQQQQQKQQTQPALLPEYYDTGSTEYLESELDRHHQKTRSRNRIRNSPELTNNTPATTKQPLLPPEISFYTSPQQQPQQQSSPVPPQQGHHHLHFARRNPSSDLIPFGYLNFRTGHDRFHHNTRRLVW